MASAQGRPDHALLIDCRSLLVDPVPFPAEAAVVVLDTGVRRKLAGSEFNRRRASCERAVAALRRFAPDIRALRDATPSQLELVRGDLDEEAGRCALHVIEECRRPLQMADALARSDLDRAGALMNASHDSLRDLYGVSSAELDHVVTSARQHSACFGARLTGAGFGGCAVALVARDELNRFLAHVEKACGPPQLSDFHAFEVRASAGARLLENPLP